MVFHVLKQRHYTVKHISGNIELHQYKDCHLSYGCLFLNPDYKGSTTENKDNENDNHGRLDQDTHAVQCHYTTEEHLCNSLANKQEEHNAQPQPPPLQKLHTIARQAPHCTTITKRRAQTSHHAIYHYPTLS